MAAAPEDLALGPLSIYKASRSIKRRESSLLYNALRSIFEDSIFVAEIAQLWPDLPLLANLRCGLWYSSRFHATCYFKSTDGHNNNWSFSTSRLNLHVATLAGQRGGCLIVDSTRKGKRFPDSMSKTIPIWACVLNRAIANRLRTKNPKNIPTEKHSTAEDPGCSWDTSLHLPLWVSGVERAAIEARLEGWTRQLEDCKPDIDSLATTLGKPLRPLWISQTTLVWLNQVPESSSWAFTPLILVSASSSTGPDQRGSAGYEFSWRYVPGAGDDEESWAGGLSPGLFWSHALELVRSGPDHCNRRVAELVEKDRVYRARRGFDADSPAAELDKRSVHWLGPTGLAVAATADAGSALGSVDCLLNCDAARLSNSDVIVAGYLHLPMQSSKFDRSSILKRLPAAVEFAESNLSRGRKLLVSCNDGEDISVCVCLAVFSRLFDESGSFDGGRSFRASPITKIDLRRRLVYVCRHLPAARPSRGNLKQVFGYLSSASVEFSSPSD
ncbi:initiator tRNA phosphoribosyl transferase family protein [Wolffia australiana]